MPVEPPPTGWEFPDPRTADGDVVAAGADLEPGTILAAYRAGLFPMHLDARTLGWWSPDPRGIVPLDGLRVTRSLRRSCRRYRVTVDRAFDEVIAACARRGERGVWINDQIVTAYRRLFDLGWVHSVEAWDESGALAGGLYGVSIGGLFAGESMFHRQRDASKVALVALVDLLQEAGATLLDVQWRTDHLASLGACAVPRDEYLRLLRRAVERPSAFAEVRDDGRNGTTGATNGNRP